ACGPRFMPTQEFRRLGTIRLLNDDRAWCFFIRRVSPARNKELTVRRPSQETEASTVPQVPVTLDSGHFPYEDISAAVGNGQSGPVRGELRGCQELTGFFHHVYLEDQSRARW